MVRDIAISAGSLGSIPRPVESDTESLTVRHRYDVSFEFQIGLPNAQALSRESGPATRYTLRRNTVSITNIFVLSYSF